MLASILVCSLLAGTDGLSVEVHGLAGQTLPLGTVTGSYSSALEGSAAHSYGVRVAPSVLHFVADNLAIGAGVVGSFRRMNQRVGSLFFLRSDLYAVGLASMVAFNLAISKRLSLMPTVGAGLHLALCDLGCGPEEANEIAGPPAAAPYQTVGPLTTQSSNPEDAIPYFVTASVFVPVLLQLSEPYFVGAGPNLSVEWWPGSQFGDFGGFGDWTHVAVGLRAAAGTRF